MTHLDPSSLAQYNSLVDPHLQSYFSSERIQSHLKHAGLISGQGEIIPDGEYRTRLARREHKKHVQHMLAENIVNRAVDIERARKAEMKRQFEIVAKAALVNNIKEVRRRSGNFSGPMGGSNDMALLSLDRCWSQTRPRSANYPGEIANEQIRIPRIKSAQTDGDYHRKYSSKSHSRRSRLLHTRNTSSLPHNSRSLTKFHDSSSSSNPCQIQMVYYGPKVKVDYDHLVFEPIDEVIVMQQHCGGENIIVFKENLKTGAEFTFDSRRHSEYPFGLTLYVKGFIDSRISTCCEYKHRHGVRLGGDRGHFSIISVKGSKPCVKCRFEKQARLKKYALSSKDNEDKKPIIIPLPISDEPKLTRTPVLIPVRLTSTSNENYAEDFDHSNRRKRSTTDEYSTDSSVARSKTNERKSKSKDSTPKVSKKPTTTIVRKEVSKQMNSDSDDSTREQSKKKTWQIVFHASNVPTGKNILLKFSFLANDGDDQTEIQEINMNQLKKHWKSEKQYSFPVRMKNIGQPKQIRLKMQTTGDEEEDDDIQWHVDHIELIDRDTESHLIFPCKQLIRPAQEKTLQLSQETSRDDRKRQPYSSPSSSRQASPKTEQKPRRSSHSSTSSDLSKKSPTKSNRNLKSPPQSDRTDRENKVRYRATIYPSNDSDGDFSPARDSRIFLRLNNQTKETNLTDKSCPAFTAGQKQTFELDLIQNPNEKIKKLTIGYVNRDDKAMKWKLQKIVLVNAETGDTTTFPCQQILKRDNSNFRAEKTFENQSDTSDEERTPRNRTVVPLKSDHQKQIQSSQKQQRNTSDEEDQIVNRTYKPKSSSIQSTSDTEKQPQTNGEDKHISHASQDINDEEELTPRQQQQQQADEQHKPKLPSNQSESEDEKQIETPKTQQQQTNGKDKGKSSPKENTSNDEQENSKKPQTNGKVQRSPSFQSMNEEEADYKIIFRKLDPKGELEIGSRSTSPTPRPITRRGREDQTEEQHTHQPVVPPINLDELPGQTARSIDQQNPSSLPSTTTDNTENQSRRLRSTNRNDGDQEDN